MKKELVKEVLKVSGKIVVESTAIGICTGVTMGLLVSVLSNKIKSKENK